MSYPENYKYAKSHEWLELDGESATVGITEYAQSTLGDIVFVELPKVGAEFEAGATFGSVESVKAVSDLFAPLDGEVIETNDASLRGSPELVNSDPYGAGWMLKVRVTHPAQLDALLDAAAYETLIAEE